MPYDDGLDDLSDEQLRELANSMGAPVVDDRAGQIELLRSYGAISPYARKRKRKDRRKFPEERVDTEPIGFNNTALEEEERRTVDEISNEAYEDYPDQPVEQWLVTLRSGNQMFAYTNAAGADALQQEGFQARRVDDNDLVSLANATEEASTPIYNSLSTQSPSTPEPKRRPKLPRRRIGRHTTGEPVADLDQQRRMLPRSPQPPPPGGGSVSHLPRHRRRG